MIASGFGYFAWNKGATLVNAGALAVMNNALVPAGLIVNIVIWNRDVDIVRLAIGGAIIMFSLWVNETWVKKRVEMDRQIDDCRRLSARFDVLLLLSVFLAPFGTRSPAVHGFHPYLRHADL